MAVKTLNRNYGDMTQGSILSALIRFAVPMMLGGLFQNLYGLADMTIAGYTLGDNAIAAISSTAAILSTMNFSCIGFNSGSSIMVANAFGEGDMEKARKNLIAMNVLSVLVSILFAGIFLIFLNPLMRFVKTPDTLFSDAKIYAVIIIVGLFFSMFYNLFASVFRAFGNSKLPLYFLIFTSILNIILDFVFIALFHWGVAGAALATIFSQQISAVLTGISFFRHFPEMKFRLSELKDSLPIIPEMFTVGISVAITNSIFAIGAIAISGAINALGSETIIAHAAANKVQTFSVIPAMNIAGACTTFTAQNYGARNYDRIRKGLVIGMALSLAFNVVTYIVIFYFGGSITRLITNTASENVVYMSSAMMKVQVAFTWAMCAVTAFRMSIQSLRRRIIPMFGTAIELVVRLVFAYVITPRVGFIAIPWAEVASWLTSGTAMVIAFFSLVNGLKTGKYKHI